MPGFGMRHRDGRLRLPESSSTFAQGHLRDWRPRQDPKTDEQSDARIAARITSSDRDEQIKGCEALVARFGTNHLIGRNALARLIRLTNSEEQPPAPTPAPSGKLGAINTTLPAWLVKAKPLGLLG